VGFPTKVQLIKRKSSEQWYINFPSAVAQAMEFARGETVEWIVEDKYNLVLHRPDAPPSPLKKKLHPDSSTPSKSSGTVAPHRPDSSVSTIAPKPSP
jgi:hypothetical protein